MSFIRFPRLMSVNSRMPLILLHLGFVMMGCTQSSNPTLPDAKVDKASSTDLESVLPEKQEPSTAIEEPSLGASVVGAELPVVLPNIKEDEFLQAALDGDASIVKRGVRQGIRIDSAAEDKRTALMLAAFNGHASIVKHLLEHKATVDARDAIQRTALMYAATGSNVETVQLLLDAGANVNATDGEENWTPLMMAAAEGQAEIVKILLKHGAIIESKDVDGETALQFAMSKGHQAVVELLKKK